MSNNKTSRTIEDKIQQLEAAVAWFDSDEFQIELATDKYHQTKQLADEVLEDIETIRNDIAIVNRNVDK